MNRSDARRRHRIFPRDDLGAGRQSKYVIGRHQVKAFAVKPDDLCLDTITIGQQHGTAASDRKLEPYRFHYQTGNPGQTSGKLEGLGSSGNIAAALEKAAPLIGVRCDRGFHYLHHSSQ
jgi:hypothetical protein